VSQIPNLRIGSIGGASRGKKLLDPPPQDAWVGVGLALARKADLCAEVLAEARRLVRIGRFGAPLNQLVFRARELLEDLDEVLVALHPARNAGEFSAAAALHRELEKIQAAIPAPGRAPHD
jgi:hypothetical protein